MSIRIKIGKDRAIVFRNKFVDIVRRGTDDSNYFLYRIPYNPINYAKDLILNWHVRWYNKRVNK